MKIKIDLRNISEKQKILDKYILERNNLKENEEIFDKKIIALFVELGEFANELKFFKYWSKKEKSADEIILDEFVDIIHFLISIANNLNYNDWKLEISTENKKIELIFLEIINLITILQKNKDNKILKEIIIKVLEIGIIYNFKIEKIFDSYQLKNEINFVRQNTNY